MCLAVGVPAGKIGDLREDEMKNAMRAMSDGTGFAFFDGKTTQSFKGYLKFDEFWTKLKEKAAQFPDSAFIIHFRMATNGTKTVENMHPFRFKGGMLIHNGIIHGLGDPLGQGISDTQHLVKLMHDLPVRAIPYFLKDVQQIIGYNKLVVLDNEGGLHISNPKAGTEDNGIWYSNSCYKNWSRFS